MSAQEQKVLRRSHSVKVLQTDKDRAFLETVENKINKRGPKGLCEYDVNRLMQMAKADLYQRITDESETERW